MTYIPGGGGGNIANSNDVALNNPSDGQLLTYDAGLQKWINAQATGSNPMNVMNSGGTAYESAPGLGIYVGSVDPSTLGVTSGVWAQGSKIVDSGSTDPETTPPAPPEGTAAVDVNDTTVGTTANSWAYTGTWQVATSNANTFNQDDHYSKTLDSTATLRFTGRGVRLYSSKALHHGIFSVSIDGGTPVTVDLYDTARSDNTLVWWSPILADGDHTVVVKVLNTKNASSSDTVVVVDRALVFSTLTSDLNPSVPGAPTNLSATAGNGSVALQWSAPSGTVSSYKVYRGTTVVGTPIDTQYTVTGLSNGTAYTFQVSAVNSSGEGSLSSSVTATPNTATPINTGLVTRNGTNLMLGGVKWQGVGYNSYAWAAKSGHDYEKMDSATRQNYMQNLVRQDGKSIWRIFLMPGWDGPEMEHILSLGEQYGTKFIVCLSDSLPHNGQTRKESSWYNGGWKTDGHRQHYINVANKYKGRSGILAWELINEGGNYPSYYQEASALLKQYDNTHLVGTGAFPPWAYGGTSGWKNIHSSSTIDLCSIHEYDQSGTVSPHWGGSKQAATELNKPVYVGEFGFWGSQSGGCPHPSGDWTQGPHNVNYSARANKTASRAQAYINDNAAFAIVWAAVKGSGTGCELNFGADQSAMHNAIKAISIP